MSYYQEMSAVSALFMELASETRSSILVSLSQKPARLSTLSRELNITIQDCYRNANRLAEAGFVKREREETAFHITEKGWLAIKQMPYFIMLTKYENFFEEHTLRLLPEKFIDRIGTLYDCEIISNIMPVLERLKKIESQADRILKIILSQAWPEEGKIIRQKAIENVQISAIAGRNTIFPKEVVQSIFPALDNLQKSGKINARLIESVNVALYITESQGALMLPNYKGVVDMNTLIVGTSNKFLEWCNDLYEHFWQQSGIFDISKTTIV